MGYVLNRYPRLSETFIVSEVLAREAAGEDLAIVSLRTAGDPRFHLADVTVAHQPGYPVLRGTNLHVRPGERVGLVGLSGSGKSTLVALLRRWLDNADG